VLGWKIVETQQRLTILDQVLDRPLEFDAWIAVNAASAISAYRVYPSQKILQSKMRESCTHNTRAVAQDIGKRTGESPLAARA
jgi:hypothetical protein